jgi:hypothetical protein
LSTNKVSVCDIVRINATFKLLGAQGSHPVVEESSPEYYLVVKEKIVAGKFLYSKLLTLMASDGTMRKETDNRVYTVISLDDE